jgi:hypothetical protein
VEQELFTNQEHLSSPPVFSGVRNTQSLVFCLVFCRSFVVLLSFCLFNPLYWLSFLDFWLLITPLVSSKISYFKTISLINMHAYYIFRIHRFDKKKKTKINKLKIYIEWHSCNEDWFILVISWITQINMLFSNGSITICIFHYSIFIYSTKHMYYKYKFA